MFGKSERIENEFLKRRVDLPDGSSMANEEFALSFLLELSKLSVHNHVYFGAISSSMRYRSVSDNNKEGDPVGFDEIMLYDESEESGNSLLTLAEINPWEALNLRREYLESAGKGYSHAMEFISSLAADNPLLASLYDIMSSRDDMLESIIAKEGLSKYTNPEVTLGLSDELIESILGEINLWNWYYQELFRESRAKERSIAEILGRKKVNVSRSFMTPDEFTSSLFEFSGQLLTYEIDYAKRMRDAEKPEELEALKKSASPITDYMSFYDGLYDGSEPLDSSAVKLTPKKAAYILGRTFYDTSISWRDVQERYLSDMDKASMFAAGNPHIELALETIRHQRRELENIAKRAPSRYLKKVGLK